MSDVRVDRLRLGVTDERQVWPTATRIEDALRMVTWPASPGGGLLVLRRLDLGWIDARWSAAELARRIEALVRTVAGSAVDVERPEAAVADAVRFRDAGRARERFVREILRSGTAEAWWWERLFPRLPADRAAAIRVMAETELTGDRAVPARVRRSRVVAQLLDEAPATLLVEVVQAWATAETFAEPEEPPSQAAPPAISPARLTRLRRLASLGMPSRAMQVVAEAVIVAEAPHRSDDPALSVAAARLVRRVAPQAPPSAPGTLPGATASPQVRPSASAPPERPGASPSSSPPRQPDAPVLPDPEVPPVRIDRVESRPPPRWLEPRGGDVEHGRAAFPDLALHGRTKLGGIGFVLPILERLGLPATLGEDPAEPWAVLAALAAARDSRRTLGAVGRPRRWRVVRPEFDGLLEWLNAGAEGRRAAGWVSKVRRELPAELPLSALVRRPALFAATPTHLDLVFPLSAVDLRVRLRALDTDPGWVPWLGRVVAFHYVEPEDWARAEAELT